MQRANSPEKTLMLGKIEGKRRKGWQRNEMVSIINSIDRNLSKPQEIVEDRGAWHDAVQSGRAGPDLVSEQQQHNQYLLMYEPDG